MMELKRDWFTLAQLASEWQCAQADLLHFAAQGKLRLSVIPDYWYLEYWRAPGKELIRAHREIYQRDLLQIDDGMAKKLEHNETATVDRARWAEDDNFPKVSVLCPEFSENHPGGHALPEAPPCISIREVVISAEERNRFELQRKKSMQPQGKTRGRRKGSGTNWDQVQKEVHEFALGMQKRGELTPKKEVVSKYYRKSTLEIQEETVHRRTRKTW